MNANFETQLEICIQKTRRNVAALEEEFPRFPHTAHARGWNTSGDEEWAALKDGYWTGGFWVGILLLCHALTGDDYFKENARRWLLKLTPRCSAVLLHDVGFLFFPSAVLGYALLGDEDLKITAKRAAYTMLRLFATGRGFIPIVDAPGHRDVLAIDTMMNLPLLWWAARVADMPEAADTALRHTQATARRLVRPGGSTAHIARINPQGEVLRIESWQGLGPDSCWSRGHAWATAGAALGLLFHGGRDFQKLLDALLGYYLKNRPPDFVPSWDYDDPNSDIRDASAAAIIAHALLLLGNHSLYSGYTQTALPILESLTENHTTGVEHPAFLKNVCLHKPAGDTERGSAIFADFYYLLSLFLTTSEGRERMRKLTG
jgi:unsaturated chondroitin disaccharide hydrolase